MQTNGLNLARLQLGLLGHLRHSCYATCKSSPIGVCSQPMAQPVNICFQIYISCLHIEHGPGLDDKLLCLAMAEHCRCVQDLNLAFVFLCSAYSASPGTYLLGKQCINMP